MTRSESDRAEQNGAAPSIQGFSGWLHNSIRLCVLGLASFLFAACACPVWFDWFELFGGRLEYEAAVRVYLTFAMLFALGSSFFLYGGRWHSRQRGVWKALGLTSILLVIIFVQDWDCLLMQEDCWIRYPTAAALILAGLGVAVCLHELRKRRRHLAEGILWSILAVGFCFCGMDELFELHEGAAQALRTSHPSLASDLVTVGYAAAGFAVVAILWYTARRRETRRPPGAVAAGQQATQALQKAGTVRGYLAAVIVFGVAQSFDTLDKPVLNGLRYLAEKLAALGHPFPEVWYLIYRPRHFMNSVEEVLELTAAVLFLFHTWWTARVLREDSHPASPKTFDRSLTGRTTVLNAGRFAFFSSVLLLVAYGTPRAFSTPVGSGSADLLAQLETVQRAGLDISVSDESPGARPLAEEFALANRGSVVSQNRLGEILFSRVEGNLYRLKLRRMFRDSLRGLASGAAGDLFFVTAGDPSKDLMPPIAWRIRFPGHSDAGRVSRQGVPLRGHVSPHFQTQVSRNRQ